MPALLKYSEINARKSKKVDSERAGRLWDQAKEIASQSLSKDDEGYWPLVVGVFRRSLGKGRMKKLARQRGWKYPSNWSGKPRGAQSSSPARPVEDAVAASLRGNMEEAFAILGVA